jgi:hypothetical protein
LLRDEPDVKDKEPAAFIVKRLREYVDEINSIIRRFEDRFPNTTEEPSAFEIVEKTGGEESKK